MKLSFHRSSHLPSSEISLPECTQRSQGTSSKCPFSQAITKRIGTRDLFLQDGLVQCGRPLSLSSINRQYFICRQEEQKNQRGNRWYGIDGPFFCQGFSGTGGSISRLPSLFFNRLRWISLRLRLSHSLMSVATNDSSPISSTAPTPYGTIACDRLTFRFFFNLYFPQELAHCTPDPHASSNSESAKCFPFCFQNGTLERQTVYLPC